MRDKEVRRSPLVPVPESSWYRTNPPLNLRHPCRDGQGRQFAFGTPIQLWEGIKKGIKFSYWPILLVSLFLSSRPHFHLIVIIPTKSSSKPLVRVAYPRVNSMTPLRKTLCKDIQVNNLRNQLTLNVLVWGMIGIFAIRFAICDSCSSDVIVDRLMKFQISERRVNMICWAQERAHTSSPRAHKVFGGGDLDRLENISTH
jgi:hypothetical protein